MSFITVGEILMSLEIGLIYGIVAVGIYLTFRIIDFPDLTCDGSFVLGAVTSSIIIKAGYNPWVALLLALIAGSLSGLATGLLNACFRVSNLLSGILVAFMLYSINLRVMGDIPNIALIGFGTIFNNNAIVLILGVISIVICTLLGYLLKTDFGLALRSIGQNKRLAQNGGINVKIMAIVGLILSNALIALGGGLFSQHQSFADVNSGIGTVIVGLASVIIGEKLLPYRSIFIQLISCILGSVIYRLLISLALHSEILGLQTTDLNFITGLMVIGIMFFPRKHSLEL